MYSLESLIGSAFMGFGGALLLIWTFVWLSDKVSTQIVNWLNAMPLIWSGVPMRRNERQTLVEMFARLEAREKALKKRHDELFLWEQKLMELATSIRKAEHA